MDPTTSLGSACAWPSSGESVESLDTARPTDFGFGRSTHGLCLLPADTTLSTNLSLCGSCRVAPLLFAATAPACWSNPCRPTRLTSATLSCRLCSSRHGGEAGYLSSGGGGGGSAGGDAWTGRMWLSRRPAIDPSQGVWRHMGGVGPGSPPFSRKKITTPSCGAVAIPQPYVSARSFKRA